MVELVELQKHVQTYRPRPESLARLNTINLLMTLGPSGAGKTTLMRASGLPMVLGDCSRAPRAGEQDGIDYRFRSEDDMLADMRSGAFVQVAVGAEGDIKATHAGSFPASGTATFAVVAAAIGIFRALPFASTRTAVIVPPDYDTWMQRLGAYDTTRERLLNRLAEARQSYEFALQDTQARFVLSDTVEAGVRRLLQVAEDAAPDDETRARGIVEEIVRRMRGEG